MVVILAAAGCPEDHQIFPALFHTIAYRLGQVIRFLFSNPANHGGVLNPVLFRQRVTVADNDGGHDIGIEKLFQCTGRNRRQARLFRVMKVERDELEIVRLRR